MNIIKKISNIRIMKLLGVGMLVISFFVGISYIGSNNQNPSKLVVNIEGYNKASADAATESWWQGAQGVMTYVRAMSTTFNNLYAILNTWGLIFNYTFSATNFPIPGTPFYYDLSINNGDISVQGTVDSAAVAYTNVIQILNGSGGDAIFQFFFDDPLDSSGGDGCMLIAKPYYFAAFHGITDIFSTTGIFEARVKKVGSDIIMYTSFSGHPWGNANPHYVESGRVKFVDKGDSYEITGLAYVHVDGSSFNNQACSSFTLNPLGPFSAGYNFYSIAYIAKHESPYYSTALWGWDSAEKATTLCELPNISNYGHFTSSSGFVCDGSPSTGCPDGDPYPTNSEVTTLYNSMDVTASGEYYPATISGLDITFPTW